ncbi:hypothetical protein BXZ70DRAFT_1042888 [Cristinia sonorae]|uniref:Uncharacterized protein n=1 Tax=Cristinia sonorae TaxID=1940300 RepID=A0A8K0UX98_9AGAR|nr:hypothetical protein BXZ70DRAFT_1042888 [Cristinia sonorae]
MSRQPTHDSSGSADPTPKSSASRHSSPPVAFTQAQQKAAAEEPSSSSPQSPQAVPSSSSEGYPSWLPKRPPPPAPRSTIHSTVPALFTDSPGTSAGMEPFVGGRKPTPRSVRIVSLQDSDIVPSRRSSAPAHARVWSRATSAGLTTTAFSSAATQTHVPRPRFRSSNFHPELLRHPDVKMRIWFFLFPIFVFSHIPLQTFFDFNAVFMLLTVAKFPNPAAPGVPGSGRNWALGAAAYIACWFIQVFVIFVLYELVYSFIRRWRVKRPLMLPLYLSSAAFNFVAMSSYTNFCFMYYVRLSAFMSFTSSSTAHAVSHGKTERTQSHAGSLRSGLAETFYFYSQNLPTVALLVPRAALSLALLLAYSGQGAVPLPAGDIGVLGRRDGTFFRTNGTLTGYARGILIANAAWSAWRIMVLLGSWLGLWIMSGHGFAGLCGPRYRWEEEDNAEAEKSMPTYVFSDNASDHMDTPLPWTWRENTVYRVYDAWDFCLTNKLPPLGRSTEKKSGSGERAGGFEGIEKVIAAVGLGGGPTPARRGMLSDELFATPEPQEPEVDTRAKNFGDIIPPPPVVQPSREKKSTVAGPYPFATYPAQVSSSEEVVPFPPSPRHVHETETGEGDDEEEDGEEDEEGDEDYEEEGLESEEPSSDRRTSGSMSSLGRPVVSRYPFQFRRPHQRGGSMSSASASQMHTQLSTPLSHQTRTSHQTHSSQPSRSSRASHFTQSTGNRETSSDSPFSVGSSGGGQSPLSSFSGNGIPMPPRHPQTRRTRAGTVPISVPSSPSPVAFPPGRPRARTRTESVATDTSMTFGPIPLPAFDQTDDEDDHHLQHEESLMDVPEAEGSIEEAEQRDSVGLLSAAPSPRGSSVNLRHLGSNLSLPHHRRSNGSRSRSTTSRSNSRSRTNSANSISESARSRAQSLIQSLAAASRSSVDLVRSRANSMARLSDSPYHSTSTDAMPSSPENYTFGHPLREQWRSTENVVHEANESESDSVHILIEPADIPLPSSSPGSGPASPTHIIVQTSSSPEVPVPETSPTETVMRPRTQSASIPIPGRSPQTVHREESQPDISTANQSFVTAAATLEGRTETSGQTPSSWGGMEHYAEGHAWKPL